MTSERDLHQAIKHGKRYVARGGSELQSIQQIARRFDLSEDEVRTRWTACKCFHTNCKCYPRTVAK